jgi:hypothetical protein
VDLQFTANGKEYVLNLFSFAREVLGYSLLEEYPHADWSSELEERHSRSLWLEPRYTYKSTVFSKTYPIWRLLENPNLRILLANATAKKLVEASHGEIKPLRTAFLSSTPVRSLLLALIRSLLSFLALPNSNPLLLESLLSIPKF